jgi:hypothetical protein
MIRLTQIDGKLPNLALMKIARHHRDRGDAIVFTKHVRRDMLEGNYPALPDGLWRSQPHAAAWRSQRAA